MKQPKKESKKSTITNFSGNEAKIKKITVNTSYRSATTPDPLTSAPPVSSPTPLAAPSPLLTPYAFGLLADSP